MFCFQGMEKAFSYCVIKSISDPACTQLNPKAICQKFQSLACILGSLIRMVNDLFRRMSMGACLKAPRTRSALIWSSIAKPTIFRENKSRIMAQ